MSESKRAGWMFKGVLCALATVLALGVAMPAYAMSKDEDGDKDKVVITYHLDPYETSPTPAGKITKDKVTYELDKVTEPVYDPSYVPATQSYSGETALDVWPSDIGRIEQILDGSYRISDGEFTGDIPRIDYAIANSYERFSRQVDRYYVMEGLPDNDVVRLPESMDFIVSSDAFEGATTTATLYLNDVTYEVIGTNNLGLPNNYRATLMFSGQERYVVLHHYRVTAYYEGVLTSSLTGTVFTATYKAEKAKPISPTPAPISTPNTVTPTTAVDVILDPDVAKFDFLPFVLGAAAVAVAGGLILIFFWWRRLRLKVVVLQDGAYKTMLAVKLIKQQDSLAANLPDGFERRVLYFDKYFAVPPKRYIKTPVDILICHKEAVLYEGMTHELMPLVVMDIVVEEPVIEGQEDREGAYA